MKQLLLIILFSFSILAIAQKKVVKQTDPLAGLDTALQRVLNDRMAAGFAVAVVSKDKIIYAKGFGYSDYEKKTPVTPSTVFAIGSCTKAFTASLLGLLNKEGKLKYDNPAREYLPALHFYNDNLDNMVTVRDLMCHRTGLPRHDYAWYLFNTSSRDTLLQRIKYQEPTAPLRQTWQYNNFMFLVQGMITESLTGKSWETNVQEKLFNPLGMKSSTLAIEGLEKNKNAAIGYTLFKDSIIKKTDYYDINAMAPAGSINSTVTDMANWVSTWINGGKLNGKEILPSTYVKEAMSSQMIMNAALPDSEIPDAFLSTYGFGWMITSYRGHYRVEHGGNIDGFSASTSFYPTDSIGIIVLANQNASAVPGIVRNIIADRLLKINPIDWNGRANNATEKAKVAAKNGSNNVTSNQKTGTTPSHAMDDYTGLFTNPGYGTFEIIKRKDSLFLSTQRGETWLRHFHYDVFELFDIDKETGIDTSSKGNLKIQYQMDVSGNLESVLLPLQPGLTDLIFERKAKEKELSKEMLLKYKGEYELGPGTIAKFYLKGDKTLYAFIEGQPEYELVATGKDKFEIKILKGYTVEFEPNESGEIIAATFVQPNGKFKAKKIK